MSFLQILENEEFLLTVDSLPLDEGIFNENKKLIAGLMSIGVSIGTSSVLRSVRDFFAGGIDIGYIDADSVVAATKAVARGVVGVLPFNDVVSASITPLLSATALATGAMWVIPPLVALTTYSVLSRISSDVEFRKKYSKLFDLVQKRDSFISNTFGSKKPFSEAQIASNVKKVESMNKSISKLGEELEVYLKKNEQKLNTEEVKYIKSAIKSIKRGTVTTSKKFMQ